MPNGRCLNRCVSSTAEPVYGVHRHAPRQDNAGVDKLTITKASSNVAIRKRNVQETVCSLADKPRVCRRAPTLSSPNVQRPGRSASSESSGQELAIGHRNLRIEPYKRADPHYNRVALAHLHPWSLFLSNVLRRRPHGWLTLLSPLSHNAESLEAVPVAYNAWSSGRTRTHCGPLDSNPWKKRGKCGRSDGSASSVNSSAQKFEENY